MELESGSVAQTGIQSVGTGVAEDEDEVDGGVKNVWGGIPAKNHKGENLVRRTRMIFTRSTVEL